MKTTGFGFILLITVLMLISCRQEKAGPEILARVADRVITVNEFIERAEYSFRPDYCREDNYIHRKIILNSLIAEKLLALEAGTENELYRNTEFQQYIRGRQEQVMRQLYYLRQAREKAAAPETAVSQVFQNINREYRLEYYQLPQEQVNPQLLSAMQSDSSRFYQSFRDMTGIQDTIPTRTISFNQPGDADLRQALFHNQVLPGAILGPFPGETGFVMIARVKGWISDISLSETVQADLRAQAREEVLRVNADGVFNSKIADLMRGVTMELNPPVFRRLVQLKGEQYYQSARERKEAFRKKVWGDDQQEMVIDDPLAGLDEILDLPLMNVAGNEWTVAEFEQVLMRHPLVFRKSKMEPEEFAEQLRLAIVDLIQDLYITEDAYRQELDQDPLVRQKTALWQDNMLALYQRNQKLDELGLSHKMNEELIAAHLNPYIRQLQEKYNNQISINTEAFEKIKLTHTDMFVVDSNVPFPVKVPSFPQVTTLSLLDYGSELKK